MTHGIHEKMTRWDILVLMVLSVLWGGSFFFIEVLVDHLPPLTIVNIRVALAAIALWVIIWIRRVEKPANLVQWVALLVLGALNNALPFTLITWGQTEISSGLASILNATTPFFTVLVAGAMLTDERMTPGKLLGVVIGVIGTAVMIGPSALKGLSGGTLGQIAVLGAALSYALAAVYARRFKAWGISPLMVATGQVTMAAFLLAPLTLVVDQPWTLDMPSMTAWSAMVGLAFFSTVIAYILYFRLIDSAGATNAALVTFLIPISAILLGVAFLGETLNGLQVLGMTLIFGGLLVMDGRIWQSLKNKGEKHK